MLANPNPFCHQPAVDPMGRTPDHLLANQPMVTERTLFHPQRHLTQLRRVKVFLSQGDISWPDNDLGRFPVSPEAFSLSQQSIDQTLTFLYHRFGNHPDLLLSNRRTTFSYQFKT
jgi:hypothetical protein